MCDCITTIEQRFFLLPYFSQNKFFSRRELCILATELFFRTPFLQHA